MRVFLSHEAARQLGELLSYLEEKWSLRVRVNFLDKLDRTIKTIATMPFAYPPSEKVPGIRKCVITPQTSLFYRVFEDSIEVISIADNRSI